MYSVSQNYAANEKHFQKEKVVCRDSIEEDKNSLQCNVCGLIISNKWNLTLHLRVHNNDRRYKCNQCPSAFITSHDLKRHTLAHAGVRPRFKCQFCSKTYASRHSKYLHEDTHNKLEYKCRYCSILFLKFVDRKKHEKDIHFSDNIFYNCSECNKKFTSKVFLENHEKNYHKKEDDAFKCKECEMFFETSVSLNIHRRIHLNKTIIFSEISPSGYQDEKIKTLKKKTPVELFGIRIHECIICTKRFTSRGDMLAHMTNAHPNENKAIFKYPCNMCEKFFKCKQGLTQHLITHTGEKKFSCSLCDYKSKRSADLKVHMRKHTGEAPYSCDKCGKRFQQVKSFQHHKKQHFGKIFKCDICDSSFYRNRELDWHKQKHRQGGFKCYRCGKLLANPYSLKSHLKIGMCQKSYKEVYGKFSGKSELKIKFLNRKTSIKNKNYECFACGYFSVSLLDMTKHEMIHYIGREENLIDENESTIIAKKPAVQNVKLMKFLKNPAEKIEYKGKISTYQSSGTGSKSKEIFKNLSESNLGFNIFRTSFSCQSLQENIVSLNGKNFVALDDLKIMDAESLSHYLKSLS